MCILNLVIENSLIIHEENSKENTYLINVVTAKTDFFCLHKLQLQFSWRNLTILLKLFLSKVT